jgi:hypothetical protein
LDFSKLPLGERAALRAALLPDTLTFAATHVPHDRRLRDWPGLRKAEAIAHGLAQHAVGEVLKRECHPDRDDASAGGQAPGAA